MYLTRKIEIHEMHFLYDWCNTVTALGNNLSNAVRFRQRQIFTTTRKEPTEWSTNEIEIIDEIKNALSLMQDIGKGNYHFPENGFMSYNFMDCLLKVTKNPDYLAKGLPKQSAQQIIKLAVRDMKSFFQALKSYKKDPSGFTGKPELPGYKRKNGHCTVPITNQDCKIIYGDSCYAYLPLIKEKPVSIGYISSDAKLKEAKVVPNNGRYLLHFVFEIPDVASEISETTERIASIDMGIDNLMAVTNNVGLPCILFKGGILKSVNQKYNKDIAAIVSNQTKGTTNKFIPTKEYYDKTNYRNNKISDYLFKCVKYLMHWCVEHRIDTLVVGKNTHWKQKSELGKTNNQNFIQIPHEKLCFLLKYQCERNNIRYIEQEESYTSKASFLDMDEIPTYGKESNTPTFSGKRKPTHYKGMYKKEGFRGLYASSDGTIINSDLNGSANILRKAFPDAFAKQTVDFQNIMIIKNIETYDILCNKEKQSKVHKFISHAIKKQLQHVLPLG